MEFIVYILYSTSIDAFYVGYTSDIIERVKQHNEGLYKNAYTKKATDWEIFHSIICKSKNQAILIERHIKRMRNRKYYFSLKMYPEIATKLLQQF